MISDTETTSNSKIEVENTNKNQLESVKKMLKYHAKFISRKSNVNTGEEDFIEDGNTTTRKKVSGELEYKLERLETIVRRNLKRITKLKTQRVQLLELLEETHLRESHLSGGDSGNDQLDNHTTASYEKSPSPVIYKRTPLPDIYPSRVKRTVSNISDTKEKNSYNMKNNKEIQNNDVSLNSGKSKKRIDFDLNTSMHPDTESVETKDKNSYYENSQFPGKWKIGGTISHIISVLKGTIDYSSEKERRQADIDKVMMPLRKLLVMYRFRCCILERDLSVAEKEISWWRSTHVSPDTR